ncbi:MAG: allophanate hydrolase [unclassified Hahellaceae]|nr:allophanate hydrolase [Hahellaceae bacterium]|tara:strand:+ start:30481 stop:32304 length:1824 start_codon:yes stop_codon:yes gene_type:complete
MLPQNMTIQALRKVYQSGGLTPQTLMASIRKRAANYADHNIWIHLLSADEQQPYIDELKAKSFEDHPLWGVPFAIKDNIDLAGIPTTAGCEAFEYVPDRSAQVVRQLLDAGAIPVGKTNLDQFATGLNGTRSPYGACKNAFDKNFISGGSSSGSAVAVALGLSSFSLGTDTAGSGRVPACFNNLIGLKPSRGLLSASGLVPACRSLDCISIFALTTDDANTVLSWAEGFDPQDGYSRLNPYYNQSRQYGLRKGPLRVGVIPATQLRFFGDRAYQAAYESTLSQLASHGFNFVEIDYSSFDEAARLLYEGPWVSERYLAIQSLLETQPEAVLPVIRQIIEPGGRNSALDLFAAQYRLKALKQRCDAALADIDCLLMPTAGKLHTIEEMLAEPISCNSELGYYTNFMNLLDLAAVAVPTAFTNQSLPFGITLAGQRDSDRALLSIANRIQQALGLPLGMGGSNSKLADRPVASTPVCDTRAIELVVCGAHLQGLPLNWQLTERGGRLVESTTTAAAYRMYALAGGPPFRPGLIRDTNSGARIEVEVWSVPTEAFGSFVANIPAPLGIGKIELEDGRWLCSFICEPYAIADAEDITALGGWRAYLTSRTG